VAILKKKAHREKENKQDYEIKSNRGVWLSIKLHFSKSMYHPNDPKYASYFTCLLNNFN